jgi:hypothetical protein
VAVPNLVTVVGAAVLLVALVVAIGRFLTRGSRNHLDELSVSRAWLVENQSRKSGD